MVGILWKSEWKVMLWMKVKFANNVVFLARKTKMTRKVRSCKKAKVKTNPGHSLA